MSISKVNKTTRPKSLKELNNLGDMPKNLGLFGTYRWTLEAFIN